ncbi:MAG: N-acetyltransferase [Chitinophagia bacterium]|nr:N-acetyltransferase [Chitinophagia bacterium]
MEQQPQIFTLITDINTDFYPQVWQLREEVLRAPIGLSLKDEDLSAEADNIFVIAIEQNRVVGCLLLHPLDNNTMKLRQMAVATDRQRQNIGNRLVTAAHGYIMAEQKQKCVLHARIPAVGFYEKLGYKAEGEVFEEVGIPHLFMQRGF